MPTKITTAEQLLRAQDLGPCELIRGELRMLTFHSAEHGRTAARVGALIANHVESHRLGDLCIGSGFVLSRNPDTARAPDVAFIGADHKSAGSGYWEGGPDLAVEVLSHDDEPGYVRDKAADWIESGARTVWVVDARDHTVMVHEPQRKALRLGALDTLRGGTVLPGFEMGVAAIFA